MSEIAKNIIANFFGRAWSTLLSILLLPIYIRIIGLEGYGMIGFYTTLLAILSPLDLGLGAAMKRELARMTAVNHSPQEIAHFTRTLEIVYWCMAFLIGIGIFFSSTFICEHWIVSQSFSIDAMKRAVMLIAGALFVQWPISFYTLGLMGLQKQVQLNILGGIFGTITALGAILVLKFVSPSIFFYFSWIILVNCFQLLVLFFCLWRNLPRFHGKACFQISTLREIKKFALGMSGVVLTTILLTQLDRLILSKMLTLEKFGFYMLATTLARAITFITGPIFTSYFPAFSQFVALNDMERLKNQYHQSCQIMSVILIPVGLMIAVFSPHIFTLWIGREMISNELCLIASVYTLGSLCNGLMTMPYALQLAIGWGEIPFYQNILAVIVLIPFLISLAYFYGPIGAAVVWLILNVGYMAVTIPVMHAKILKGEMRSWYFTDLGRPLAAIIPGLFFGWAAFRFIDDPIGRIVVFCIIAILCCSSAFLSLPELRRSFST